jgi:hypothetical protein
MVAPYVGVSFTGTTGLLPFQPEEGAPETSPNALSILAAMIKSFSCRPSILWVKSLAVTLPQESGMVPLALRDVADDVDEIQRGLKISEREFLFDVMVRHDGPAVNALAEDEDLSGGQGR